VVQAAARPTSDARERLFASSVTIHRSICTLRRDYVYQINWRPHSCNLQTRRCSLVTASDSQSAAKIPQSTELPSTSTSFRQYSD
jgi:hypothetical protein